MSWWWFGVVFGFATTLVIWCWCNWYYGRIYGQPLRWRYLWVVHAALLFRRRQRQWEKRP